MIAAAVAVSEPEASSTEEEDIGKSVAPLSNMSRSMITTSVFEGEFSITNVNFPLSLESLDLNNRNTALTSLDLTNDDVPNPLRKLFLIGVDNFTCKQRTL